MPNTESQNEHNTTPQTDVPSIHHNNGGSNNLVGQSTRNQQSNTQTPVFSSEEGSKQSSVSPYSDAQQQTPSLRPNRDDERALRSAQNKITFAYVAGPLSLFFGGMLLGCVGLICAGLAYRSVKKLEHKEASVAQTAAKLKKSARNALIICCAAFLLNAISLYFMYPIVLEMLQNGQFGDVASSASSGSASSSSTWG